MDVYTSATGLCAAVWLAILHSCREGEWLTRVREGGRYGNRETALMFPIVCASHALLRVSMWKAGGQRWAPSKLS